jgi:hypothetical protein
MLPAIRIEQTARPGQESASIGPEIVAGRTAEKSTRIPGLNLEAAYAVVKSIRKSSIRFPDLSCAVSQRGFFPRPAQVSDGSAEFLYFGNTCT